MHSGRIGVMLGFSLLILLDIINISHGKAFPEDSFKNEGKQKDHYKVGTQFQHFKRHQNFPPKTKLFYTPQLEQPIFIPTIKGSASHVNKFFDDYYKRNKEHTQSWMLGTPVTYDYSHSEKDYDENHVTSNVMVKNLLDETNDGGVHLGNYILPPITRESNLKYGLKRTRRGEDFGHKGKSSEKLDLRAKGKKENPNRNFFGTSTQNPVFVSDKVKTEIPDVDYAPEVVDAVNKLPDDEYAPEVVDVVNKLPDDDYAPEVVDVVNIKKHRKEKVYRPKTEHALENVDEDCDEMIKHESQNKDKTVVKQDKKPLKKSSSSSNINPEVVKSVSKKTNKLKRKKRSQSVKQKTSSEPKSEVLVTKVEINTDSRPVSINVVEFDKSEKMEESSTKLNVDAILEISKETESTVKPASKHEYIADKTRKVIRMRDKGTLTDGGESHLDEDENTECRSSSYESFKDLSEGILYGDESSEKLESMDSQILTNNEPLNVPERFENFDIENPGSGAIVKDENIMNAPQFFHNMNSIRSLSSLNSNIWSLIFNPNAERNKLKKCVSRGNETGYCMYIQQCEVSNIATSLEQLLNYACVIDDIFIGICCPEFPVQTVKVHWEQMPSNSDKQIEDEFGHDAEDCGIRSDEASKAQSWPWKAPLVSMSNGKIFCGGVIINEDYILTAAHCTTKIPKNQILVRLGQHDDTSGEDFAVVEIKRHAQYNPRTMHDDIALLKLGRRIVRDKHTDAICLPNHPVDDEDEHAGEKALLLGWQNFGKNSKKTESLEVMTNKECEKKLGVNVPATSLCTETRNGNERTCNADSGAPLVVKDDGKYEVIGILTWNRNDCDQRFPSTFSRVSKYVRWIQKHAV